MTFSALDSALTGPLFATAAMRACFSDEARLAAMLRMESALARAEAGHGLVADELAVALEAITPGQLDAEAIGRQTALAGVPTIPFIHAVQALLPRDMRGLHWGATTQDVLDTALVLQCGEALELLRAGLVRTMEGLSRLARTHCATPCVGRTYGQHAAPVTFGFKVAVWLAGVAEVAERWPGVRDRLLVASLGGPVGTLTALGGLGPAVLSSFAGVLGLGTTPISWHVRRARMAEAGCWLATLVGALAKMAIDIVQLASTEVGEVAEPHQPGRGGSSAMPHKRNPVSCTVILAAHAAAPGLAAGLLGAMAAGHERPAGAWHGEWHALPALFGLASGALQEASVLAHGLEVDAGRMAANIEITQGLLFADAAAGCLAATLGRHGAHDRVERAASEVRASGVKLRTVLQGEFAGVDFDRAFDLGPAVAAAAPWVDRAIADAGRVGHLLQGAEPCL